MAHAEDEFLRAELTGGVEKLVHQGKKRRVAFEREAFVAEIARLKDLLKQFGPDQVVENALLIDGGGRRLHVIGEPAAALRIGNVGELDADAAAINASRFLRDFALGGQFRMRLRAEKSERIEFRLDVSPAAEQLKNAFALAGCF